MIIRAEHQDGFTVIKNDTLRDNRVSIEARGFLAFLLTMNDGWEFSISGLAIQTGLPERSVMRLTKELKAAGYIQQKNKTGKNGTFAGREWIIQEEPEVRENRTAEKPHCGETALRENRTTEPPHCGKSAVIRNNNSKEITTVKKEQREKKSKRFTPPTIEEVATYCQERNNAVDAEQFVSYYNSVGWKVGKNSMKDWKAAVITWERRQKDDRRQAITEPLNAPEGKESPLERLTRLAVERAEGGNA